VIRELAVVIPARNEDLLIESCLRSIRVASRRARIIVVADSCVDRTVELALPLAEVIEIDAASVGVARAIGVAHALEQADVAPDELWIANTDADSTVPENWIAHQLSLTADVYIGSVRPNAADLTPDEWLAWAATHDAGQAIGHVHGANLGFRANAYSAVGGFAPITEHEDNDLVHRLLSAGFTISASDRAEVVTSGRRVGRTPGGYAGYLRNGAYSPAPDLV
jgi:glycosyltransferase involved in cell wall biosynthesis